MLRKEWLQGSNSVETKGIVGEIDSVELGQSEQRGEQVGQSIGDLRQEASCEDVGKVGDLQSVRFDRCDLRYNAYL